MSVNSFMTYVKKRKDIAILLVVLALGLILLLLGSSSGKVDDVSEETLESKMVELCSSVDGVGKCKVMVYCGAEGGERVESVVVVCEGADSVEVRKNITDILSAFFGIGSNRVKIEKMAPGA